MRTSTAPRRSPERLCSASAVCRSASVMRPACTRHSPIFFRTRRLFYRSIPLSPSDQRGSAGRGNHKIPARQVAHPDGAAAPDVPSDCYSRTCPVGYHTALLRAGAWARRRTIPLPVRPTDTEGVQEERTQLRQQIVRIIERHATPIASDTLAAFPFAGPNPPDAADGRRLCELMLELLVSAIDGGDVDFRSAQIAELRAFAEDRGVTFHQLFDLAYLLERTALDE